MGRGNPLPIGNPYESFAWDRMAIVSNKYYEGVQELKRLYFADYVSVAIGEKEGIRKKPAPDTVLEALKELGSSKERAV